jgi:cell division protein FtsB
MRKLIAIFIAISLLQISTPVPSFAQNRIIEQPKKKHIKKRKLRKAIKKQKKEWEKITSRSNDFREEREKYVGEHMLKKQTPAEQKRRRKNHLKPDGTTY